MQPNKHLSDDIKKPFHSNGYAQVASGDHIGAAANVSFDQRQAIDCSRRIVNGYQRSALGNSRGSLRARPLNTTDSNVIKKSSLQQFNSGNMPVAPAPKPQSYNPYA